MIAAIRSFAFGLSIGVICCGTASSARAGFVEITGGFYEYNGAVAYGSNPQVLGDYDYRSYMNGMTLTPSSPIAGLENGFTPPDPNDPDSVGTGLGYGTASLGGASQVSYYTSYADPTTHTWVDGQLNLLGFTPGPQANVSVGQEFLLGTISLQNGAWFAADPIHTFTIELTTHSTDPALDGHVFSDTIVLNVTPNAFGAWPPENNADIYTFANHPELGSIRLLEAADGNPFGTVQLFGKIGSLDPTALRNPTGGAFLSSSLDPFPPPGSNPVPEPGTVVLLVSGLVTVAASGFLRRKRGSRRPLA
jgi:hypothetical protein